MNKTISEIEKTIQHPNQVGHASPISAIVQAKLLQQSNCTKVNLVYREEESPFAIHEISLILNDSITLGNHISPGQPFTICVELDDPTHTVPPVHLCLDENGDVILDEAAETNGWAGGSGAFIISCYDFGTAISFTAPSPENGQQEIIIVGTVPTP